MTDSSCYLSTKVCKWHPLPSDRYLDSVWQWETRVLDKALWKGLWQIRAFQLQHECESVNSTQCSCCVLYNYKLCFVLKQFSLERNRIVCNILSWSCTRHMSDIRCRFVHATCLVDLWSAAWVKHGSLVELTLSWLHSSSAPLCNASTSTIADSKLSFYLISNP